MAAAAIKLNKYHLSDVTALCLTETRDLLSLNERPSYRSLCIQNFKSEVQAAAFDFAFVELKQSLSYQIIPRITTMSQDKTQVDSLQENGTDARTQPTYKEQLDEAAIKVKNSQNETKEPGVIGQVVEKGKTSPLSSRGNSLKTDWYLADL